MSAGVTLTARPCSRARTLYICTLLAVTHLWLLRTHPQLLTQVLMLRYCIFISSAFLWPLWLRPAALSSKRAKIVEYDIKVH